MKLEHWNLAIKGEHENIPRGTTVSARVPGDITYDLFNAGLIENPYYGLNHKNLHWIINEDFEYSTEFDVGDDILSSGEIILDFESVDTFADVYLNGKHIGSTDNMFKKYSFSVKNEILKNGNKLVVKMRSTGKAMEKIDDEGYFGVFNTKRLFVRKAQCHFGWDWAPDMPGYGICGEVSLRGVEKYRIDDISYKAFNEGLVTVYAELNYTVRPQMDFQGKTIKEPNKELVDDVLRYTIATEPDKALSEAKVEVGESKVIGKKNFKNFKIENPELWYPSNMGKQPLYAYKVELVRGGKVIDVKEGKFAFREVKLIQKPTSADSMGYLFEINGAEVFVKGSNWVPIECFTGTVKDEKYEKLIKKAVDANFNMLRVWGGGVYERDVFYELCDKYGIMVWQDVMLACADIPEDDPQFVNNVLEEVSYQIKRLRNHPSIVYWCGGNEKTGSYGLQICRGDRFVDVYLRGIINDLDGSRPYARQSPCSQTDIGNDKTSGESHAGSFETGLVTGVEKYRDNVENSLVPFVSECAVMGADTLETYKKIFPEDKLWDMNEYWDDRLMDNPYSAVLMPFTARQRFYAEGLYGKCTSIENFICKSMTAHAETIRAEIEFARSNKGKCGGFMNWMYSDIWPSASWAVINYYCEPKQVYYQMKKSYAPYLATFVQKGGKINLTLINDGYKSINADIVYGLKKLSGEVVWSETLNCELKANGVYEKTLEHETDGNDAYMFVSGTIGEKEIRSVWSKSMWKNCSFKSDYVYSVCKENGKLKVTVKANAFAKGVTLKLPNNCEYDYTDNYFDLESGEEKTVYISGGADEKELVVTDFAKEIAK